MVPEDEVRVLLRAELLERGYDASGAPDVPAALAYPPLEPQRDAVRAILLEQSALAGAAEAELARLWARHPLARRLLLTSASAEVPAGPWHEVLRRPLSVARVVAALAAAAPG